MSKDREFFDTFLLVLGILVLIAGAIFLLARVMGERTQGQFALDDPRAQELLAERLQPVGRLATAEDTPIEETVQSVAEATTPVATTLSGPQVYNAACIACHGAGIGGAPKLGDADAWASRVEKGLDVLYDHSINGFQGDQGYMPPKGGRVDLSDDEVRAAVDYMIEELPEELSQQVAAR